MEYIHEKESLCLRGNISYYSSCRNNEVISLTFSKEKYVFAVLMQHCMNKYFRYNNPECMQNLIVKEMNDSFHSAAGKSYRPDPVLFYN